MKENSKSYSAFLRLSWLLLTLVCVFTAKGYSALYDPVTVYLTWQRSPETTMTIRWITSLDRKDNLVEYRQEEESSWISAEGSSSRLPGESPYLLHTIELTNLYPGTNYFFRTGSDAVPYKFQTMPAYLENPVRFVVGGDMYHDTVEILSATNRQAAKTSPMFALVGGDIAYASDKPIGFLPRWAQKWVDTLFSQKIDRWLTWLIAWKNDMVTPDGRLIPFLPAIGNHDTSGRYGQTPAQAPFFYSLFAMPGPQGYNVLDFGNYMSLIILDSGHTHPIENKQTAWLASTLEQRKDVPHKFALYHVPAYPSVRSFNEEICTRIRKYWVPIFDRYHLTGAFEHHDHDYKRTHLLLGGKIDATGVLYLGDGAWGVDKPRMARNLAQKWYLAHTAPFRHFLSIVIKQNERQVTSITPDGNVLDEFSW